MDGTANLDREKFKSMLVTEDKLKGFDQWMESEEAKITSGFSFFQWNTQEKTHQVRKFFMIHTWVTKDWGNLIMFN